mgnify:CR=1 FL=1
MAVRVRDRYEALRPVAADGDKEALELEMSCGCVADGSHVIDEEDTQDYLDVWRS